MLQPSDRDKLYLNSLHSCIQSVDLTTSLGIYYVQMVRLVSVLYVILYWYLSAIVTILKHANFHFS